MEATKRVHKTQRILDAGCSDGFFSFINMSKGKIYGVDINSGDIEIAKIRNPKGNYQVKFCTCPKVQNHRPDRVVFDSASKRKSEIWSFLRGDEQLENNLQLW